MYTKDQLEDIIDDLETDLWELMREVKAKLAAIDIWQELLDDLEENENED